ncbi:MAG: hypothetical protein ACPLRJ_03430 [Infirmifilum uzonense]|jgi:predicted hydrocarbon binding protein|uniref:hypothetical protein n=2 Tax=Infirmifilum TaxID=2856573 RepID=UPI003C70E179
MSEPFTGVSGLIVEPGKNISLVLAVLDKQKPLCDFLKHAASCSEDKGLTLLDLWTTRGEFLTTVLIALTVQSPETLKSFTDCLSKNEAVKATSFSTSRWIGLAVESWGFPALPHTGRVLVLEKGFLEGFLREGWRLLGRSLGLALYHSAFSYGQEIASRLRALGLEGKDLLILASEVLRHLGYGRVYWEEFTDSKAIIVVHDSLECKSASGVPGYESSILRGIVAGIAGTVWQVDKSRVEARETACISRGDQACRIEVYLKTISR